jgi:hypothetical protein
MQREFIPPNRDFPQTAGLGATSARKARFGYGREAGFGKGVVGT